jgi:hypothetical protein
MEIQFGKHGRHIDVSGQAADIGLFRMTWPKPRKTFATQGSALIADGRTGRAILARGVGTAIALGLGAFVATGTPDASLAANEAPDAQNLIASAEPYGSSIDLGISLAPRPISPGQPCRSDAKFCLPSLAPAATSEAPANGPPTQAIPRRLQGPSRAAFPQDNSEDQAIGKVQRQGAKLILTTRRLTAIYDIDAHIVYMPNGEQLEAHSGLGDMLDDPDEVHEKNRGPTPPDVYDLVLREQPFHGVQALRLIPVGIGESYGRDGFLAHSFMRGPQGFSNGCVVFKNYDKFLDRYLKGEVKHLIVIAHMTWTDGDGNLRGSGRQQVKACNGNNLLHLGRRGPHSKYELLLGCSAIGKGAHREARRSSRGSERMGTLDVRNKQLFRRPARPAVKDS